MRLLHSHWMQGVCFLDSVNVRNDDLRLWIFPVSLFLVSWCWSVTLVCFFFMTITQEMTGNSFSFSWFYSHTYAYVNQSDGVSLFAVDNCLSLSLPVLCFQGGSALDHLLHASHRPHPAGLLLLHWAAARGWGASGEGTDAATGRQDQAAAEHAAGKDHSLIIDLSLKKKQIRFRT